MTGGLVVGKKWNLSQHRKLSLQTTSLDLPNLDERMNLKAVAIKKRLENAEFYLDWDQNKDQEQLPLHNKWTDSRLRLAHRQELQICTKLRPYLGANRAIRKTAIDIHYWKAPFIFYNLDELKDYFESMPTEAKRYVLVCHAKDTSKKALPRKALTNTYCS